MPCPSITLFSSYGALYGYEVHISRIINCENNPVKDFLKIFHFKISLIKERLIFHRLAHVYGEFAEDVDNSPTVVANVCIQIYSEIM